MLMNVKVDVSQNVMAPMRDGVKLATDIYRPRGAGPLPAIMTRTPYDKGGFLAKLAEFKRLAASGFVVVVQDKRGMNASEGQYSILQDDSAGRHQDGYDTVEWIAGQPWSDGRVIAYGLSYLGHTTLGAVIANPPHLIAAMSIQPSSDGYTDRMFTDGVLNLKGTVDWASIPTMAPALVAGESETDQKQILSELPPFRGDRTALYRTLPLDDFPYLRHLPMMWGEPLRHREDEEFFAESRVSAKDAAAFRIPIVHVGGWFDLFTRNTVRHYELADKSARQLLVVGPWRHGDFTARKVSGVPVPGGEVDTNQLLLEWAHAYTDGKAPLRENVAAYIYVLGANRWRAEPEWPIRGTEVVDYYLGADGGLDPQPGADGARRYEYDPRNPYSASTVLAGLPDLTASHEHPGVVVYRSKPLTEPVEITGWPAVTLSARTTATDVDWLVELNVVDSAGVSRLLSEGIARARYRNGRERPEAVVPGRVESYRVEMRPISVVIAPGERIEIAVSGGKFPTYERNPGSFVDLNSFTDDDLVVSQNEILSGVTGSRVSLPIVPATAQGTWVDNPWPGTLKWRLTFGAIWRLLMSLTGLR